MSNLQKSKKTAGIIPFILESILVILRKYFTLLEASTLQHCCQLAGDEDGLENNVFQPYIYIAQQLWNPDVYIHTSVDAASRAVNVLRSGQLAGEGGTLDGIRLTR